MNDVKGKVFSSHAKMLKLKLLPPRDEALEEHIKYAHIQVMFWKEADSDQSPNAEIIAHKVLYVTPINGSNMAPTPMYGITMVSLSDLHVNDVHVTDHVHQQGAAAIINLMSYIS